MKLIQKGNRQLRVDDVRAEELIKAGYVEIDQKTGKPIVVETEEEKAQKALVEENAALKAKNEKLKAEIKKLTAKAEKAAKKAETPEAGAKPE